MKTWLYRIFTLLIKRRPASTPAAQLSRVVVSLPARPNAPEWLPEFEAAWKLFLHRDVGAALMERLRALEYCSALGACERGTPHAAGVAHGWTECRQWLESISQSSARQSDGLGSGADQLQTDEKQQDMQPPGEAELYERYSP